MIHLEVGQKVDITWQHPESSGLPDYTYLGVIITGFRDDGVLGNFSVALSEGRADGCFPWDQCIFKPHEEPVRTYTNKEVKEAIEAILEASKDAYSPDGWNHNCVRWHLKHLKQLESQQARQSAAEHLAKDVEKWLGSAPRVIRERIKPATGV